MLVTNTQRGPRGLNTLAGPVYLAPNQSADVEMSEAEAAVSRATGWFDFEAPAAAEPAKDGPAPVDPVDYAALDMDELRKLVEERGLEVIGDARKKADLVATLIAADQPAA